MSKVSVTKEITKDNEEMTAAIVKFTKAATELIEALTVLIKKATEGK